MTHEELELFLDYLRFPSISACPEHSGDVRACAEWLLALLSDWGLEARLHETGGAPAVLAKLSGKSASRTLLIYGHYDVQPIEPLSLWETPPFEPGERDGRIFARGATDNKGQTFSLLLGLKRLLESGPPMTSLVILLEGEEEIGSPHLEGFLQTHRAELACDAALICDTGMIEPGWPALTLGLRGIACFDIEVDGPKADLHSGMFGSATPNPALALARVLGRLHDDLGFIVIPGFYDGVTPVSQKEKDSWASLPWDEAWFVKTTGIEPTSGERRYSVLERIWARPTAEINGLTSGHQGSGSKTIIPAKAFAKLTCRLVPGQDPERIAGLVQQWVEKALAKEGVRGKVTYDHGGKPFHCPVDDPALETAAKALESVFEHSVAYTREGLSIPVAAMLREVLEVPVILVGLGLPDCQAHAPNESFPITHLEAGANFLTKYLENFSALHR